MDKLNLGTYKLIKQPNQYKGKFLFKVKVFFKELFKLNLGFGLIALVLSTTYTLGGVNNPKKVYADRFVPTQLDSPIMDRIAYCESSNSQFDSTGQVLVRPNTNHTVDIGKYQINSVWNKKATELHLNLFLEQDNKTMAYWIYNNRGTQDWLASYKCWSK